MTYVTKMFSVLSVTLALAGVLAGCTKEQAPDVSRIEDRTFTLRPANTDFRFGVLTGQLSDLTVTQRIDETTGEVVYAPQLRATLKLKNTSPDQAVRLLAGGLEYLGPDGKPIPLAENRGNTDFNFYSYASDRLDPGMESSHNVDVPFPAAALDGRRMAEIRLSVTYIPTAYREESVTVPLTVAPQG